MSLSDFVAQTHTNGYQFNELTKIEKSPASWSILGLEYLLVSPLYVMICHYAEVLQHHCCI